VCVCVFAVLVFVYIWRNSISRALSSDCHPHVKELYDCRVRDACASRLVFLHGESVVKDLQSDDFP